MKVGNILTNHTLKEYNDKYGKNKNLLHFSKDEVKAFDNNKTSNDYRKATNDKVNNLLLADRDWWLIGDTYYEVPKHNLGRCHLFSFKKGSHKPATGKKFNKKAAIIATACVVGVGGALAGGHFIYKAVQENKTILQKLGGSEINRADALKLVSAYDFKVADNVNVDLKLSKFEVKNATFEKYDEEGVLSSSNQASVSWNGVHYNNRMSYRDMLILSGFSGDEADSDVTEDIKFKPAEPAGDNGSTTSIIEIDSSKLSGSLTSISMLMFHQVYDYNFEQFNAIVDNVLKKEACEIKYLNNNDRLGIYINITDLSKFFDKEALIDFNFTGTGTFECGININKEGFIDRFLLNVNGPDVVYRSNVDREDCTKVKGEFNIKLDAKLDRTNGYADEVSLPYYINGKEIDKVDAETCPLETPEVYMVDPLWGIDLETGEVSGIVAVDKSIAFTNRTYTAKFKIKDSMKTDYEFDLANSAIIIDGIDYTKSTLLTSSLANFVYDDNGGLAVDDDGFYSLEIDRTLISKKHKYAINLAYKKISE